MPKGERAGSGGTQRKLQQAFTVGGALGRCAAAQRGFVTGLLHRAAQLPESQPGQRVPPMQADHRIIQRFKQRVAAADVGALMQQHGGAGLAGQAFGQVDARAQQPECEGRRDCRTAVAAVRRFAGQRHPTPQPSVLHSAVQQANGRAAQPESSQQVRRGGPGGGGHIRFAGRQISQGAGACRCVAGGGWGGKHFNLAGGLLQHRALRCGNRQRDHPARHGKPHPHSQPERTEQPTRRVGSP